MASKKQYKTVIPKARNLLDYIIESYTNKLRDASSSDIGVPHIVDRAKTLVKRSGLFYLEETRSNDES